MRLEKLNILLIVLLTSLTTALSAEVHTQYPATVCGTANYLFGCTPLTASAEIANTLGDSTVHLKLIVADPKNTTYPATINEGETYLFGCEKLTAAGETSKTVQQAGCECDSTVHLVLKVQAALKDTAVQYSAAINEGETYLFGCALLTKDTVCFDTLHVGGRDSVTVLTLKVQKAAKDTAVQYSATINEGETYLFGCALLTKDTVCFDTLHLTGRDSVTVLTLKVSPALKDTAVQYSATINEGETYLFGCAQLTKDTVCFDTLHVGGRDSVTVLTLKVSPALKDTAVQYSATINEGETYLFGCAKLTKDTVCFDTLHLSGRDSVTVLTLKVTPLAKDTAVQYEATIKQGETYLFGCAKLTKDTVCFDTLHVGGRDSVTVLTLKVTPALKDTAVQYEATIKQGETYLFGCKQFTNDTTYADTLRLENRDSVTVLILTVVPDCPATIVVGDTVATICESELPFLWHGLTLKGDTTMCDDTLRNVTPAGCDSIVRLTLTVMPSAKGTDAITGCDSVVFKGVTYKTSTTVYDTIAGGAANGCDSIVTVTLTVKPHAVGTDAISGCESVVFKGITYKTSTTVYDTIAGGAASGCDSIVTVTLTVKQHAVGTDAISGCDSVVFKGMTYKTDATVLDTLVAANGCDSIVTVTISVKPHAVGTDAIIGCDSVVFKGMTFKADTTVYDTIAGGAANGCDSIVSVTITVKPHAVGTDAISGCESVVFKGMTFKTDATVLDTLVAANGCDSIVTVTITVLKPDTTVLPAVDSCNRYHLKTADIDTLITTTGDYKFVLQNANGCDSVVTINVTIAIPYETTLTLIHKFGDRLLMIHRHEINAMPGWHLDSLDTEHPEYVEWHQINPNTNVDSIVGHGYTYSLPSGDPLPAGYTYYAYIEVPGANTGGECGSMGETMHYTIPAHAAMPALMPSLVSPGEEIRVINLNPTTPTTIRVFSADGVLHSTYNVTDAETCSIKADYNAGFYMVEVLSDGYKSTLRYIVQ